jgi:hypothetical protein
MSINITYLTYIFILGGEWDSMVLEVELRDHCLLGSALAT